MVREVLSIAVGQGGIQLSNAVWNQYCKEHDITDQGAREKKDDGKNEDSYFKTFFEETRVGGSCVPRNLYVDLEPTVIDDVKRGKKTAIIPSRILRSW